MVSSVAVNRLEVIRHELCKRLSRKEWARDIIGSQAEGVLVLQTLADAMTAADYPQQDVMVVTLTVEQVIDHSLRSLTEARGGGRVRVSFHIDADRVLVEVEDPNAEEDLQRLFAFRDLLEEPDPLTGPSDAMTWVEYGHHHSKFLMLCKHRSPY